MQFGQSLAAVLRQGEPLALPEIWRQLLTAQSQNWHLLPEDLQALTELGQGLGSSGLSNQQRLLALTEQRLQRLAAEAEERRGRLARLLGGSNQRKKGCHSPHLIKTKHALHFSKKREHQRQNPQQSHQAGPERFDNLAAIATAG